MLPFLSLWPGGPVVRVYPALIGVAIVLSHTLGVRWIVARTGIERGRVRYALGLVGIAALAGARLHGWIAHALAGTFQAAVQGDSHAPGAFVAVAIALPLVARRVDVAAGAFADALAPVVAAVMVLVRVACFAEGCCVGCEAGYPWCPRFPPGSLAYTIQTASGRLSTTAASSLPAHPLQLYFALAAALTAVLSARSARAGARPGAGAAVALLVWGASTALLEPLRASLPGAPPTFLAWIAAGVAAVGAAGLLALAATRRPAPPAPCRT